MVFEFSCYHSLEYLGGGHGPSGLGSGTSGTCPSG